MKLDGIYEVGDKKALDFKYENVFFNHVDIPYHCVIAACYSTHCLKRECMCLFSNSYIYWKVRKGKTFYLNL